MRIGFFAKALYLQKGGIERFSSRVSRYMQQLGHECIIFHQGSGNGSPLYPLHKDVQTCDLKLRSGATTERDRQKLIDANLDVMCVMNSSSLRLWFLQLLNHTGIPLLMSERSSPAIIESFLWNRLERIASFAAADGIHLLSDAYCDSIPDFLRSRITIIPNPAPKAQAVDWDKRNGPRKRILAVGRLTELDKKNSLLIEAFSLLGDDFPDWDCSICGEGDQWENYTKLIKRLSLEGRVLLEGQIDDVEPFYQTADIFCMPSAFEGSPNALLEAQSYGLASVGFSDCTGVNEVVVHGENGHLAEIMDAKSLANALRPLMESSMLRRTMGEKAHKLLHRYDEDVLLRQWEEMLRSVAACKNNTRLNISKPTEEEYADLVVREIITREDPLSGLEQTKIKQKRQFALEVIRANVNIRSKRK
jgi:glycosyltransferase involved in cell wall biosynthesis